jgi:hypothetical protein
MDAALVDRQTEGKRKELTGLMIPYWEAVRKTVGDIWRRAMSPDFSFALAFAECGLWPKMRWQ